MKHKWLEEIGVNSYPDSNFNKLNTLKDFFRHIKLTLKKRKTGIDVRDCWDLDSYFYENLYEHCMQYKYDADKVVDLEYNKFIYKDKEYTQIELINYLCEKLKEMILWDDFKGTPEVGEFEWVTNLDGTKSIKTGLSDLDREEFQRVWEENYNKKEELKTEIFEVWKILIDCMWW